MRHEHDRTRYIHHQCRCSVCRAANAAYMAVWRAKGTNLIPVGEIIPRQLTVVLEQKSQRWLSKRLGIDRGTLADIANRRTTRMTPATAVKLAGLLNVG